MTPKNKIKDSSFGGRIRDLRLKLPRRGNKVISQKIVANEAGVSLTAYQEAETGIVPGVAILYKLSKYFKCSVDYLRTGQKDVKNKDPILSEGDGLYGRTKIVDVEGKTYSVTQHVPPGKEYDEPRAGLEQDHDPFVQAIAGLKEIFDSQDPFVVPALQSNIRAFLVYVRREKQIMEQNEEIKRLQDECDDLKKRLSDLEEKFDRQSMEMEEFKKAAAGGE